MQPSQIARTRKILMVFIGAGAVFALIGLGILINSIQFTSRADTVVARVVENPSHRSTSGNSSATLYQPIFNFTDAEGNEVTAQVGMSSSSFNYQVDSEVEIYHIPGSSPPRIRIASFGGLYLMPAIFLFVGLGAIAVGGVVMRAMRNPKSREAGEEAHFTTGL